MQEKELLKKLEELKKYEELLNGLYFIHGYYSDEDRKIHGKGEGKEGSNTEEIKRNRIVLTKESPGNLYAIQGYDRSINDIETEVELPEGCFLYFQAGRFFSAESDERVLRYKEINGQLMEEVNRLNYGNEPLELSGQITDVCSYHVNVGHENCSIIAFRENGKGKVFMVDCSTFDFMERRSYAKNLDACMEQVKMDFQTDKISKLMITHLHYDHINGIKHLIDSGWMDGDTEVWMNTRYPWAQEKYSYILWELLKTGVRIIDPVAGNSTQHIKILYPVISFNKKNKAPKNHINNASVLYQVCLGGKSMLFPGDLETEGWDKVRCCKSCMGLTTYYCISHHSSITGHLRTKCLPMEKGMETVMECMPGMKTVILMGRNHAYQNIFNQKVLDDISDSGRRVVRVEKETKYVRLKWDTGEVDFI